MKKFSNITSQTVGQKPEEVKIDEAKQFKYKLMSLMEQFLNIKTYGPVDRYLHQGSIEIGGRELLAEAIVSMFDEKTIKEQTAILESLKATNRDWETIDNKIDELNSNKNDFKTNYKVDSLLEKYTDDELLLQVLTDKVKSVNELEILESYLESFNKSNLITSTKNDINKIYSSRIEEIKNPS